MLMIGRPVDPAILDHITRTEQAVAEYQRLDQDRSWLQVAFAWIFAIVALLVLLAAVAIGLVLANQIARPIGRLILAAERVRSGDLGVRVTEAPTGDELAGLSRAFNRMTGQLAAQRGELMDAYSQIDERRRFTETVLSGVSAGVIGLDASGRIELPNRAANELLGLDLLAAIGRELADVVPEFADLLHEAAASPERARTAEIQIGPPTRQAHAAGADRRRSVRRAHGRVRGDVRRHHRTAVGAAQGRLGRCRAPHRARDQEPADADPACRGTAEAAVRARDHLGPRHVHASAPTRSSAMSATSAAWSTSSPAFARMPQPVIKPEDVGRIAREALVLQRTARPQITWRSEIPERGPVVPCDRTAVEPGADQSPAQCRRCRVAMRNVAGTIGLRRGVRVTTMFASS